MNRVRGTLALCAAGLFAFAAMPQEPVSSDVHRMAPPLVEIAPWARPSDTGRYVGYTVGGGSANLRKADAPLPEDGTWGWDYQGGWFRRRVILGWWHGRRFQGGTGAYQTDGPAVLHPLGR
jgi:hypothetical protein